MGFDEPRRAENPAVPTPITLAGSDSSARAAALPVLSVHTGVDQPGWRVGNPDASLSADGRGSDVAVRRGRDLRDGCVDSDNLLRALRIAGRAGRNVWCSSGCRDHSGYRSVRRCGNQRTGSVFRVCPLAVVGQWGGCRGRLRHDILRAQRRPRQKGASGRGIGTGLAVGADVAPAFPPAGQLSTPSATYLPRFACQTTIATQSIRRMPCGQQIVKPAYPCLRIKNKIHYRIAALRAPLVDARFLRKSDTVNT